MVENGLMGHHQIKYHRFFKTLLSASLYLLSTPHEDMIICAVVGSPVKDQDPIYVRCCTNIQQKVSAQRAYSLSVKYENTICHSCYLHMD